MQIKCKNCGATIVRKVMKTAKYCSGQCRQEYNNKKRQYRLGKYVKKT